MTALHTQFRSANATGPDGSGPGVRDAGITPAPTATPPARIKTVRRVRHRVHQELERRRHVAEGLREILNVLNSNRALEETLDYIVASACRLLGTDSGAIFRLDATEKTLTVQAARGLPADYVAHAAIPIGQGAVGKAALTHAPSTVSDTKKAVADLLRAYPPDGQPYLESVLQEMAGTYVSVLSVPLIVKDEVYGGISLYYRHKRRFSYDEIELASTFGDQAALAIENARLRLRAEQAAVAAERTRIARDLHDSVTQTLFSASLIAEVLPRLYERDKEEGRRRMQELRELTRGALAEMRMLLLELRPATLKEVCLGDLLRQLAEATTGRSRVPIEVAIQGGCTLPPDVHIALYRIAQEALNNVARHSGASRAALYLRCSDEAVEMRVSDDGRGFDVSSITPEHLGVSIMRERAEDIGAALDIVSSEQAGTTVSVSWTGSEGGYP